MKVCVIIPAAGLGQRFNNQIPKQFVRLNNVPVIVHTLRSFETHPLISSIILSVAKEWIDFVESLIASHNISKIKEVIVGGTERQFSIENALLSTEALSSDILLVHDAVRPFPSQKLITSIISSVKQFGAAIPALPPKETIKSVNSDNTIIQTLDRSHLQSAQTPQGFYRNILLDAYRFARVNSITATDDASLVEAMGIPVLIVEGEETNIKLTTPLDFKLAELILHNLIIPSI